MPQWRLDAVISGSVREIVTAAGTINPLTMVNVGTDVSGKVAKIYKDFNAPVEKGDILAELDKELLENALENAKISIARARTNAQDIKLDLDLLKELVGKEMATAYDLQKSQNKYDLALQNLQNAQNDLQRAKKNLDNATITSPISGVVVSRNVDEGQTVAASLNAPTLFVIANNLQQMKIEAEVDEADIGRIRTGLPVEFSVDAYPEQRFFGKVNQIRLNPTTQQNVVSYTVIIEVRNDNLKLLPGMTANVSIVIKAKDEVLKIPESALRFKPSKELWKQFGLKWDDELYGQAGFSRNRRQQATDKDTTAKTIAKDNTVKQTAQVAAVKDTQQKPAQVAAQQNQQARTEERHGHYGRDGRRPNFENMTTEQRKAMRERFMQQQQTAAPHKAVSQVTDIIKAREQMMNEAETRRPRRPSRVWILVNGKPEMLQVTTGISDGTYIEVLSGLEDGQEIITGVTYKTLKKTSQSPSPTQMGGGFRPHF